MFSDATLNLFAWYRDLKGGLWLEENQDKHAWIIYDSDKDNSLGNEEYKSLLNDSRIRSWRKSAILDVAWATLAYDTNE